ncbi:universal stress protein [Actinoplanes sp. KI2]|uniref:universal stress protein n=1 Tax=Actinoplanes sp. KI2 TaxID=2983315 RepID=UPI0021D57952|nr:universal stress protein [Actinoplanes sp. KI2]MCU7729420.1 universal stress protein [Actinoplanes sp. KI2]
MTAQIDPHFVLAALDDDSSCADVLIYARGQARQRGLPLRVVHVWTRRESMTDSDRLLTAALYDNLPPDEAATVERQILHDDDPARALAALSRDAALVVAAAGAIGEPRNGSPSSRTAPSPSSPPPRASRPGGDPPVDEPGRSGVIMPSSSTPRGQRAATSDPPCRS